MEIKEINGELAWVKADGSISRQIITHKQLLKYYGFEFPWADSGSVYLLKGDPRTRDVVLLKVSSKRYFGNFLLRKPAAPGLIDCAYVKNEDTAFAESLLANPPPPDQSLEEIMDKHHEQQREMVDVKSLAGIAGLKVWEAAFFEGYWCREAGEFNDIPPGWGILPRGDAMLTRRVRRGPHWVLLKKQKKYTVEIGTIAPEENIERTFQELGGEPAQSQRLENKVKSVQQREQTMTLKFQEAIRLCYPGMPEQDIQQTIESARRRGAVGAAQWLYFHMAGQGQDAFIRAAVLAVRAHVRHQHTDYDRLLIEPPPGQEFDFYPDEEHRKAVRWQVHDKIEDVLAKWR